MSIDLSALSIPYTKLLLKFLAIRLKGVVDSVVGMEQTAYIQNRNILDGPLILSEVISWIKRRKGKALF